MGYQRLGRQTRNREEEYTYVPHNFVHQLRQPYGVACRASAHRFEGPGLRIRNVTLMIRTVYILTVPATVENESVYSPKEPY